MTPTKRWSGRWEDRFKVMPNGCHRWLGYLSRNGYGRIQANYKSTGAHRYFYEKANGKIPDGFEIDHLCGNRACVNAEHLEAVTHFENIMRGNGPSAVNARKIHCKRGHVLLGDNLEIGTHPSGLPNRRCKACRRTKERERYAKKMALV